MAMNRDDIGDWMEAPPTAPPTSTGSGYFLGRPRGRGEGPGVGVATTGDGAADDDDDVIDFGGGCGCGCVHAAWSLLVACRASCCSIKAS